MTSGDNGFSKRAPIPSGFVIAVVSASPVLAQRLGQAPNIEVPWFRYVSVLALCLCLAVGAAFALKARTSHRPLSPPRLWLPSTRWLARMTDADAKRLQLIETLRLSAQVDLCIVRCDGADFALAVTAQGVSVLPMVEIESGGGTAP